MKRMNAHFTANLGLTLLLWAILLIGIWLFIPYGIILRIILSLVTLVIAGFIGERVIPRITGPVIEKIYKDE